MERGNPYAFTSITQKLISIICNCRSYYFSIEELELLANSSGFRTLSNDYVHRRTINKKENIDAPRIFIQCKFQKLGNV